MEGIIVGFSDSGTQAGAFAVVGLPDRRTMVIPVDKLKPGGQAAPQGEGKGED